MARKKYESCIKFHYDGILKMNGEGITKVIKGRWEEISLGDFIEDFINSAIDQGIEHVHNFSFFFSYDGLNVDYDADLIPDSSIDEMNDFIFYSNLKFIRD